MKTCNKCSIDKNIEDFHKDKASKDGRYTICKSCKSNYVAKRYRLNPEKFKEERKQRYAKNPEKERELCKLRSRVWRKENPAHRNALKAAYRADKIKATPAWANKDLIKALYQLADMLNKNTDQKWHVDHEVPLRHPLVCGLHTYENLKVITAEENMKKHNKFEVA